MDVPQSLTHDQYAALPADGTTLDAILAELRLIRDAVTRMDRANRAGGSAVRRAARRA